VPVLFAVAEAGQASADPGICVSGPWGVRIGMHQRARMGRLVAPLERRVEQRLGKR